MRDALDVNLADRVAIDLVFDQRVGRVRDQNLIGRDAGIMRGAELVRYEGCQGLADDLSGAVAEYLLSGGIPGNDQAFGIGRNDRIAGRADDGL